MMPTEQLVAWLRDRAKGIDPMSRHPLRWAANRLEQLQADRATMAAALKKLGGCGNCKHCEAEWDQDPCNTCRKDQSFPKWEWKGE